MLALELIHQDENAPSSFLEIERNILKFTVFEESTHRRHPLQSNRRAVGVIESLVLGVEQAVCVFLKVAVAAEVDHEER